MTEDPQSLPVGWVRRRLGDVLKLRNGYAFKPTEWVGNGRPIIRIQNLNSKSASYNHYNGELPDRFSAKTGDLLFAWSGTPGTSFGAHVWEGPEAWINQHIFRVDFSGQEFDRDFLKLAINHNLNNYIAEAQGGVGLAHITKAKLNESLLITPPVSVQRSIASLISSFESKQTSSARHLADAKRAIERFRQAVLAAACSGRLTADWRDAHPHAPSVKTALVAIPRRKHRSLDDDLSSLDLPDLPESYVVSTVGQASIVLDYGTSRRADNVDRGIPVLRMGNIQDGQLDLVDLKYIESNREIQQLILADGDLLFNRTNSPELVGKSAVFHEPTPMTFASYLIRVRFASEVADPDFVNYWINSAWGKAWARQVKTDGVSQSNINGTKLGAMPLPLPPIEEQREIVRRASHILGLANSLLVRIKMSSRQLDRTSQAILAKAFRGELVLLEVRTNGE